jgi:hypothetical protein
VQGYPADLTVQPGRLAVVVAVEAAILAVVAYAALVAAVEVAYLVQARVRTRAGL